MHEKAQVVSVIEGDLIKVSVNGEVYEIRLYFSDSPDLASTELRSRILAGLYNTNADNIQLLAENARDFTQSILSGREIIVTTKKEKAPTNDNVIPRYYGFIHFKDESNNTVRELGEVLCRTGHATPNGKRTDMPNSEPASFYLKILEESRTQAFIEKRGAWSMSQ